MRTLAIGALAFAATSISPGSRAEPPFVIQYSANYEQITAGSKEDVCQNIFPQHFHPELNWNNTRFNAWGGGMTAGRYAHQNWGFSCIGDNDTWTNDIRNVGFVWCGNNWYVDTQTQECVCAPGTTVKTNGVCVAPQSSGCTLTIDGVCHGGKNNGPPCPQCGNPINPANGNKFHREPLYAGPFGLRFDLSYNTQDDESTKRFSKRWRDSFDRRIAVYTSMAVAYRGDGRGLRFLPSSGVWVADADISDRLTELQNPPGTRVGWELYVAADDSVETYDIAGRLLSIASRSGLTQTLTYSDGTGGPSGFAVDASGQPTLMVLPAGLLLRVTDAFGRTLQFAYNAGLRVARVTDPAGNIYRFTYDGYPRLGWIYLPDGKMRVLHYNEPAHTGGANHTFALTGITDENGDRFATYSYDAQGRAVATEHAAGVEQHTVAYNSNGSAVVTSPLGAARTFAFQNTLGKLTNTAITGPACPSCGPASQTFDANGNVASRTDWNGNRTNYTYDLARNLETTRTEGLTSGGAPTLQTRTITTAWHPTFRLPTQIAQPLRITTNVYDADGTACGSRGALCSRTVQATNDADGSQGFAATQAGTPRTWSYTYNGHGLVLTVNGPRTDISDLTTYTYDAEGNVSSITNAASHITSITSYNAHGQALTIVDANALTTTLTYDERQRLKTRTVGSEVTSYDYDGVGQLIKVTLPDGSFLSYNYDAAHRLIGLADSAGNRIAYTLDPMGNRTQEQVFDPTNQLAQTRSRVFSSLDRLFQELGAQSQTTEYTYDDHGNVLSVKDPLDRVTSNQYDALNRLKEVTDPDLGVTQYVYNGLDALLQVTDPRSLVTSYAVDGLGNLNQQVSPDTGTTVNTYDAAGNLLTQTDAKSQTTTYAYDALNRVTLITFHDSSKQAYAYDQGPNGIGRLSSITETDPANQVSSVLAYAYDARGRVISETRTVASVQYLISYSYDSAGRLSGINYPSGRTVTYAFDTVGRIYQITAAKDNASQIVVQAVLYHPFGGVKSFILGNGQSYSRGYDQDGRIASYTLGAAQYAIGYDAASRIEFISEAANPPNTNTYGYDNLDRLTGAVLPGTLYAYSYDAVGNRVSRTVGSATETFTYSTTSNRVGSLTPASGPVRNFVFDANGATTSDGVNTYAYDVRGRMTQATTGLGTTNYQINALGQRVRKTNTQGDSIFHYDSGGRLILETGPSGTVKREYIYLGDIPVAVVVQ